MATRLLLLCAAAAAAAQDGVFSPTLPDGVGDVSRWTVVTGDFETETERGTYRLYVNPARSAMYQLMRYRVEVLAPVSAVGRRPGDAERVAFVRRPGVPEPMACWERQPGTSPAWRQLTAGTEEYVIEMGVLMHVLAVHRAARTADSLP